jgi:hypothetical protein
MRKIFFGSIVATAAISSASVALWSQQTGQEPNQSSSGTVVPPSSTTVNSSQSGNSSGSPYGSSIPQATFAGPSLSGMGAPWNIKLPTPLSVQDQTDLKRFAEMIKKLREAEEGPERQKLVEEIRTEVSRQFDNDVNKREQDLAEIEKRVKRMREQLEASRSNRDNSISSIMTMIENPNAGLGLRREWIETIINQSNAGTGSSISYGNNYGAPASATPSSGYGPSSYGSGYGSGPGNQASSYGTNAYGGGYGSNFYGSGAGQNSSKATSEGEKATQPKFNGPSSYGGGYGNSATSSGYGASYGSGTSGSPGGYGGAANESKDEPKKP